MVDLQLIIDLYEKMEDINTSDLNEYIYKMHSKKTKDNKIDMDYAMSEYLNCRNIVNNQPQARLPVLTFAFCSHLPKANVWVRTFQCSLTHLPMANVWVRTFQCS